MSTSSKSRWLEQISLKGFLSFGPEAVVLELGPLNVLIGSNGSGKSNFIEALAVLRSVPRDLPRMIRRGGGVQEFLWKGESPAKQAQISFVRAPRMIGSNTPALHYYLSFGASENQFTVLDERMWEETGGVFLEYGDGDDDDADVIYLGVPDGANEVFRSNTDPTQSILSQRQDPEVVSRGLVRWRDELARIGIYRNWSCGPEARDPSIAAAPTPPDDALWRRGSTTCRPGSLVLRKDVDFRQRTASVSCWLTSCPGSMTSTSVPEGGQLQLYVSDGVREHAGATALGRHAALPGAAGDPARPGAAAAGGDRGAGAWPASGYAADGARTCCSRRATRMQLVVTTHSTTAGRRASRSTRRRSWPATGCEGVTQLQRLDAERVAVWREARQPGPAVGGRADRREALVRRGPGLKDLRRGRRQRSTRRGSQVPVGRSAS
jgi:energy-coupling factor transporter ATP-binding protein EcfA2